MPVKKSITVNFIMNFLLTASSILFPLISFPYVSRILGPAGTGAVAMATSLISYFTMIAMLGIPVYGIRACAAVRDDRVLLSQRVQELLIINLVMAAVAYVSLFITIWLVPAFRADRTLYMICSAAIILNVIGVNWVYQALEQYSYITMMSLFFKALGLVLMFLLVRRQQDVLWYGVVTVVSSFGSGLLNFIRLRTLISLSPCRHYDFKIHINPILTFFAMSVATTIYTNLDVVMLGVMKDSEQVGYYNAAIKIKTIMVTMVTSLGTVLLPRLSYYFENNEIKKFYFLISKAFSFVLLFSVPVCIYFTIYAGQIIQLLSGAAYLPAAAPMIILMPTIPLIGLSNITGIQILVPTHREKMVLKSVVLGACLDFLANLLLIPLWGPSGAAAGTLLAELAVTLLQFWYLKDVLKHAAQQIEFKKLLWALIPALLCLPAIHMVNLPGIWLPLILSAGLYFGVYGLGLLLVKEEILWGVLNKFLKKARPGIK